jgi:pimeloyl-ACP methyl ester carboxylesterase
VLVDGRLWDDVWPGVAAAGYRCVLPNLPLGAHRHPLQDGADRTPAGQARRRAALIRALGHERAVLVGNDSGGAICQVLAAEDPDVVDRLVLTSADALKHFPPALHRPLVPLAHFPRLLGLAIRPLTLRPIRRMPFAFGWLSRRPIPDALVDDWFGTLFAAPANLRDLAGFIRGAGPRVTLDAAERLRAFPRPALMAWAVEDRFFPYSDGEQLAAMIPQGRLVPITDSYTFTPIDQPIVLAEAIASFLRETEPAA